MKRIISLILFFAVVISYGQAPNRSYKADAYKTIAGTTADIESWTVPSGEVWQAYDTTADVWKVNYEGTGWVVLETGGGNSDLFAYVSEFGADGTFANDTSAIKQAYRTGKPIYLDVDTLYIDDVVLTGQANFVMVAKPGGSTLKRADDPRIAVREATGASMLYIGPHDNYFFDGYITFHGNKYNAYLPRHQFEAIGDGVTTTFDLTTGIFPAPESLSDIAAIFINDQETTSGFTVNASGQATFDVAPAATDTLRAWRFSAPNLVWVAPNRSTNSFEFDTFKFENSGPTTKSLELRGPYGSGYSNINISGNKMMIYNAGSVTFRYNLGVIDIKTLYSNMGAPDNIHGMLFYGSFASTSGAYAFVPEVSQANAEIRRVKIENWHAEYSGGFGRVQGVRQWDIGTMFNDRYGYDSTNTVRKYAPEGATTFKSDYAIGDKTNYKTRSYNIDKFIVKNSRLQDTTYIIFGKPTNTTMGFQPMFWIDEGTPRARVEYVETEGYTIFNQNGGSGETSYGYHSYGGSIGTWLWRPKGISLNFGTNANRAQLSGEISVDNIIIDSRLNDWDDDFSAPGGVITVRDEVTVNALKAYTYVDLQLGPSGLETWFDREENEGYYGWKNNSNITLRNIDMSLTGMVSIWWRPNSASNLNDTSAGNGQSFLRLNIYNSIIPNFQHYSYDTDLAQFITDWSDLRDNTQIRVYNSVLGDASSRGMKDMWADPVTGLLRDNSSPLATPVALVDDITTVATGKEDDHVGDGVTTVFAWTYTPLSNRDVNVRVTVDGVVQEEGVDYTYTSSPKEVTFTNAPANGTAIKIFQPSHILPAGTLQLPDNATIGPSRFVNTIFLNNGQADDEPHDFYMQLDDTQFSGNMSGISNIQAMAKMVDTLSVAGGGGGWVGTATSNLNMDGFSIVNAGGGAFSGSLVSSSTLVSQGSTVLDAIADPAGDNLTLNGRLSDGFAQIYVDYNGNGGGFSNLRMSQSDITYNGTSLLGGGGGASSLNDLTDVTVGTPGTTSAGTVRVLADPNSDGTFTVEDWTPPTASGGITDVVQDLTPELGGDLAAGGNDITGVGNVSTSSLGVSNFYRLGVSSTNIDGYGTNIYGELGRTALYRYNVPIQSAEMNNIFHRGDLKGMSIGAGTTAAGASGIFGSSTTSAQLEEGEVLVINTGKNIPTTFNNYDYFWMQFGLSTATTANILLEVQGTDDLWYTVNNWSSSNVGNYRFLVSNPYPLAAGGHANGPVKAFRITASNLVGGAAVHIKSIGWHSPTETNFTNIVYDHVPEIYRYMDINNGLSGSGSDYARIGHSGTVGYLDVGADTGNSEFEIRTGGTERVSVTDTGTSFTGGILLSSDNTVDSYINSGTSTSGLHVGGTSTSFKFEVTGGKSKFNNDVDVDGNVVVTNGSVVLASYTVATLPASPVTGSIAYVTDSNNTYSYRNIVSGGGSTVALVFYDGTNWIYH